MADMKQVTAEIESMLERTKLVVDEDDLEMLEGQAEDLARLIGEVRDEEYGHLHDGSFEEEDESFED